MSFDDWKYDRGWRGTIHTLGEFGWALVRFGLFLVVVVLVIWFWISFFARVFS